MAGSRLFRPVVLVCLWAIALAAQQPEGHTYTNKEIRDEFMGWVDRMGQKHAVYTQTKQTEVTQTGSLDSSPSEVWITVDKSGKGDYKSVKKAVKSIPDKSSTRYVIFVKPGIYKEKVKIPDSKGPITLLGSGNKVTKITYDNTAMKAGSTLKSASVSVYSDYFIAKDITFENSAPAQAPGAVGLQAVAFMIAGNKAAFFRVAFLGYQDTLYDRLGLHYFKDCYVRGSIDFIFGDGQSYYETCYLDSVATTFGSLSAQKRMTSKEDTGYSFVNSVVNGPTGYVYLSRAWGPSARVVFMKTYLPASIRPEGWSDWDVPDRYKTVFFGEYQCYGPGANRAGREFWSHELTYDQAKPFMTVDWIEGDSWIPKGKQ